MDGEEGEGRGEAGRIRGGGGEVARCGGGVGVERRGRRGSTAARSDAVAAAAPAA